MPCMGGNTFIIISTILLILLALYSLISIIPGLLVLVLLRTSNLVGHLLSTLPAMPMPDAGVLVAWVPISPM